MLAERIDDRAIPRLIKKWLRAGVLDTDGDGAVTDEKVDDLDCHGARRICRPAFLRSKVSSSCLDELPWCRSSKKVHRQNTRGTATKEEAKKVEKKTRPTRVGHVWREHSTQSAGKKLSGRRGNFKTICTKPQVVTMEEED